MWNLLHDKYFYRNQNVTMGSFTQQFLGDEPVSPSAQVSEEKELLTEVPESTAPVLNEQLQKKKTIKKKKTL